MAKEALEVADRVIFTGPESSNIQRLLGPAVEGRLFAIESIQEVARLLEDDAVTDELILIKSGYRNHLERLILAQDGAVRCWKQDCLKKESCVFCAERDQES